METVTWISEHKNVPGNVWNVGKSLFSCTDSIISIQKCMDYLEQNSLLKVSRVPWFFADFPEAVVTDHVFFTDSTHVADISFLFGKGIFCPLEFNENDLKVINEFSTRFTNFAKFGWVPVLSRIINCIQRSKWNWNGEMASFDKRESSKTSPTRRGIQNERYFLCKRFPFNFHWDHFRKDVLCGVFTKEENTRNRWTHSLFFSNKYFSHLSFLLSSLHLFWVQNEGADKEKWFHLDSLIIFSKELKEENKANEEKMDRKITEEAKAKWISRIIPLCYVSFS